MGGFFSGSGGGGGSFFSGGGGAPATSHGGGHSWTHALAKIPGSKIAANVVKDVESMAVHAPQGVYDVGKGFFNDVKHGNLDNTKKYGSAIVHGYAQDFEHPLRHPGNTLLDVFGLASGGVEMGARLTGMLHELAHTGDLSEVARIAKHGRMPEKRMLGGQVQGLYSTNTLSRQAQKLLDTARETFPEKRLLGRSLVSRMGHETGENRRVYEAIEKFPAARLQALGKRLSGPEQMAIRVVAEGKPIDARIAFHQKQLDSGDLSFLGKRGTQGQIDLLGKARKYVDESSGKPQIAAQFKSLSNVYNEAKNIALKRDQILHELGLVKDESLLRRPNVPGRIIEGSAGKADKITKLVGDADKIMREGQLPEGNLARYGLTGDARNAEEKLQQVAPEIFHEGEFRVPYSSKLPRKSQLKAAGYRGGIPKRLGSFKHFEGKLLAAGIFRNDTTRLLSESYIEAERFAALLRGRDQILSHAKDTPEGIDAKYAVPIRTDELKKPFGSAIQQYLQQRDAPHHAEWRALGTAYEGVRSSVFPDHRETLAKFQINPDEVRQSGVKWIDRRMLGGLDQQNPLTGLLSSPSVGKVLSVSDAINNASRLALLYLKPAYAVPNMLGNVALNLVQQGFAAPKHLARAAGLWNRLPGDLRHEVTAAMGEGIAEATGHAAGIAARATQWTAGKYGKIVDEPFRISSFLFEAERAGYKSSESIRSLLHDSEKRDDLIDVTRRANESIIDYADMNEIEKAVIRRVIFLYPWIKGAGLYGGRFLRDHPAMAANLGQSAKISEEEQQQAFGGLPSWAESLIPTGHGQAIDPSSMAILQEPADVAKLITESALGNRQKAVELASFLTPVGGAELAALSNKSGQGKDIPPNIPIWQTFLQELYRGTPQVALAKNLTGHQSPTSAYHYSQAQALLRFLLLGGLTPRNINPGVLPRQAEREKTGK